MPKMFFDPDDAGSRICPLMSGPVVLNSLADGVEIQHAACQRDLCAAWKTRDMPAGVAAWCPAARSQGGDCTSECVWGEYRRVQGRCAHGGPWLDIETVMVVLAPGCGASSWEDVPYRPDRGR